MAKIHRIIAKLLICLLQIYRWFISPLLGNRCRFYPSCSCYAVSAIDSHGVFQGGWLVIKRLLRCHPLHPGGFDPVPTHNQTQVCVEGK